MLFYIGQIFCALVISLTLHIIKIKGISCAERINRSIEQTTLGIYLNDIADIGIFYLRKFTKQQLKNVSSVSLKEYTPRSIKKSMLRVRRLEGIISDSSQKTSDVVDPEKLIDQKIIFEGVKNVVSGTKTTQNPNRDVSSSSEE